MSSGLLLVIIFGMMLFVLFMGAPVSMSMGFTAVVCLLLFLGWNHMTHLGVIAFKWGTSMNQIIAPMFILMSEFLSRGGIAEDIYYVLNKGVQKIKGGLAISTTLACTVFAALCGSSPATAASIGRISISEMTKRGYRESFAVGTVAAGGTLGIMIPPSIGFVMFGIITETSIVKLLMAGLIPGIMLALLLIISIVIRVRFNRSLIGEGKSAPTPAPQAAEETSAAQAAADQTLGENIADDLQAIPGYTAAAEAPQAAVKKESNFLRILPSIILILVVLGALYAGWATPMEAAGYGVVGAFFIILFQKRLTLRLFFDSMRATARTGTMIVFLILCGFCMSYVISYLGIAGDIAQAIVASGLNRYVVMIVIYILWFFLGCLMDPSSMIILTIPFIFQTLTQLGFDPLWIGVVSTLSCEIGMITPPVGLNLFVLRSNTNLPMGTIIKGALPYVIVLTIGLVILTVFPDIALWIPSLM